MNPKLQSFVTYCEENPTERFWQALRNWSKADYIFRWRISPLHIATEWDWSEVKRVGLEDTFYIEDDEV